MSYTLNSLVNLNKDLFELMRKSARKVVAGSLVYNRDYTLFKCQRLLSLQTFSLVQRGLSSKLQDDLRYMTFGSLVLIWKLYTIMGENCT